MTIIREARHCASVAAVMLVAFLSPPAGAQEETYEESEIAGEVADFFETTTVAAGEAVARIFADNGEPNAYITGNEGSGAIGVGLRYGEGNLYFKSGGGPRRGYWQGPAIGFDVGGNASKVFVLVYDLTDPDDLIRRFPGVEGAIILLRELE